MPFRLLQLFTNKVRETLAYITSVADRPGYQHDAGINQIPTRVEVFALRSRVSDPDSILIYWRDPASAAITNGNGISGQIAASDLANGTNFVELYRSLVNTQPYPVMVTVSRINGKYQFVIDPTVVRMPNPNPLSIAFLLSLFYRSPESLDPDDSFYLSNHAVGFNAGTAEHWVLSGSISEQVNSDTWIARTQAYLFGTPASDLYNFEFSKSAQVFSISFGLCRRCRRPPIR